MNDVLSIFSKLKLINLFKNHVSRVLGNTENILSDLNDILNGNHNYSYINKIKNW